MLANKKWEFASLNLNGDVPSPDPIPFWQSWSGYRTLKPWVVLAIK